MSPKTHDALIAGLRHKIKHVFVIFQENHSFDNYFGTYPGAENLGTAFAKAHGYSQFDPIGARQQTVFRTKIPDVLGPQQFRYVLERKFDNGKMDKFITAEEGNATGAYGYSAFVARQFGLTTMASYDCDTIPYLWMYAKNFTLLDHYFQAQTGESSPSAVSLFAAQAGISQAHRFPDEASSRHDLRGVPIVNDLDPFLGPYEHHEWPVQIPQSYASLAMLLGGATSAQAARSKPGKVAKDLATVASSRAKSIPWEWDQEGFVDSTGAGARPGYEGHHNAPQYFDYVRLNSTYWSHVGTAQQALTGIEGGTLPDTGVYFIKGSSRNEFGWKPANKNPLVQKYYLGDDDHPGPGDTDSQVGEAFVATYVNAIAKSKYWKDSAIIITWDDGGGFFDHVPPRNWESCNDGYPCGDGQRLPFILISPYSASGSVVTDYSDAASVAKFVEAVFNLPSMASLPDEKIVAPYGPRDALTGLSDLAGAFDPNKLSGATAPNPPSMAEIPDAQVGHFPPAMSCSSLHIKPIAIPPQPSYYNPLKTLKSYEERAPIPEAPTD